MVRITTWNVNGIRNPFGYQPWRENRTFSAMFDTLQTDIVIMQELKIQRKDLTDDMVLVPGWDCYFSLPKHKKGKTTLSSRYLASRANILQDTLVLASILASPSAPPSALRKVSLAFSALQTRRLLIASDRPLRP